MTVSSLRGLSPVQPQGVACADKQVCRSGTCGAVACASALRRE
ncbi:MAG: hypothetical protein ACJ790_06450 [Myxococcaceae bacterium]